MIKCYLLKKNVIFNDFVIEYDFTLILTDFYFSDPYRGSLKYADPSTLKLNMVIFTISVFRR